MLDVGRWMFDVRQFFIRNGFMTTTLIGIGIAIGFDRQNISIAIAMVKIHANVTCVCPEGLDFPVWKR